jgi:hypothetical protein
MAKLITKGRLVRKPVAPPPAPKELTLEEIRERHEFGTTERAIGECQELVRLKDAAKELVNATNRQKTQAGKAFKALVADDTLAYGDEIQIGTLGFTFDYAKSDSIDAAALYAKVVSGDVPLADFLKCVYINKDMANKVIGSHIVDSVVQPTVGKKADIRIRDLDKAVPAAKIVRKPPVAPPKSKIDRSGEVPVANVNNPTGRVRPRRRIHVTRR